MAAEQINMRQNRRTCLFNVPRRSAVVPVYGNDGGASWYIMETMAERRGTLWKRRRTSWYIMETMAERRGTLWKRRRSVVLQ